jgi:hypothetical protein
MFSELLIVVFRLVIKLIAAFFLFCIYVRFSFCSNAITVHLRSEVIHYLSSHVPQYSPSLANTAHTFLLHRTVAVYYPFASLVL